jgi:predicted RNase H-like nuclease
MNTLRSLNPDVVAGVDGCRRGWLVAIALTTAEGTLALQDLSLVADFGAVLERTRSCAAVAVDMPIGLSTDGRRQADSEARRRLGPRRSSVFPAPPRCVLDLTDYEAANTTSKARFGRGLQRQTFNILPKIRAVDAAMTLDLQDRIVESHPEVSFWALRGERHLQQAKRTAAGAADRLRLLESLYGPSIRGLTPPRGAARDDLYDACVLAWTASRVAARTAVHLPDEVQRDNRGIRMEIVY